MEQVESSTKTYKEYIESLNKKQLVELICGNDKKPPLLTRNEPKYSRSQLIWGLIKSRKISLEEAEEITEGVMNKIEGYKWDKFYNYDYFRLDIRKPGCFYIGLFLFFGFIGLTSILLKIYRIIF